MTHPGDRVHVLVAVVVAVTSALADAVVVIVALHQGFVRGLYIEGGATDTWLFVPLDVTW